MRKKNIKSKSNKDITLKSLPSKGISIVIKNDFQPEIPEVKQKKRRKYKKKVNTDILKMPTMPSYIPEGGDVSYIKPQYNMSSLNRNIIFPGVPQSLAPPQLPQLPPPPPVAQILPPPQYPQLPAPPTAPLVNFNLDGNFQKMLENMMMPMESGFKKNSYAFAENIDDDIMDTLPKAQQEQYIENKVKPQIEKEMKDINFENAETKTTVYTNTVTIKTARTQGTRHANKLIGLDDRYKDNENYVQNYVNRLQEILNDDSTRTKPDIKKKVTELLKAVGVDVKPSLNIVVPTYVPPTQTNPLGGSLAPSSDYQTQTQTQTQTQPKPQTPPQQQQQPPQTPPRERVAIVLSPKPKPKPKEKSSEIEEEIKPIPPAKGPPPPPIPPGKGPGPPPPPPMPAAAAPKPVLTSLLDDTQEEKDAKAKAEKEAEAAAAKGGLLQEMKEKQERAPKMAGTKNGKSLSTWTEQYIDNLNYRKNYISELESIRDNDKTKTEDKEKAKELLDNFKAELIKRAKEYAIKDTSLDTISPLRIEYKDFKDEYEKPYMKKMKKLLEETKEKYKEAEEELSKFKELNKYENRKTLNTDQKKKLKVKLEEAEKSVKFFSELIEKIKEYSGIKN